MMFQPAVFAFVCTILLTFLALKFFPKFGLLDRPEKYGLMRKPIPYFGGLILYFVFLLTAAIFFPWDKHLIGLAIGATMIVAVSLLDDKFDLSPWSRLSVQILAAIIIIFSGIGIKTVNNPFGGGLISLDTWQIPFMWQGIEYHFTVFADLFTIVWIVLIMNTMNWVDGLNGLPSGITVIAASVLFFLAMRPGQTVDQSVFAPMALTLAAIASAFLMFDFHPAKILMGDTGSMFLGFLIAVFAIFAGGKIATAFLVLGFPILDAGWVIARRLYFGISPMKGDLKHFHHRLLEIGFSERKALFFIYSLTAGFGLISLFLGSRQKLFAIVALVILMALIGGFVVFYARRRKLPHES